MNLIDISKAKDHVKQNLKKLSLGAWSWNI